MAIETSPDITEISKALIRVQRVIEGAKKDSVNPFHKSKYADLTSVWNAARVPLVENGLAVVQGLGSTEQGWPTITTMLVHESGQWIRDTLTMEPKEKTPQGVGSAITYGRRYALSAIVGISPEDDDGETAQGRPLPKSAVAEARAQFVAPVKKVIPGGTVVTPSSN